MRFIPLSKRKRKISGAGMIDFKMRVLKKIAAEERVL